CRRDRHSGLGGWHMARVPSAAGSRKELRDSMNCFTHNARSAVGICSVCQKAVCHECVGQDTPRLVCRTCAARGAAAIGWGYAGYAYRGFEYKSPISIGGWPLLHVCSGIDPETLRPRVAKGIVAIGNLAVDGLAIGGLSCGLFT